MASPFADFIRGYAQNMGLPPGTARQRARETTPGEMINPEMLWRLIQQGGGNVIGTIGGFLGGGEGGEAPPEIDESKFGGPKEEDPAEVQAAQDRTRKLLKQYGWTDEKVEHYFTLPEETQWEIAKELLGKEPAKDKTKELEDAKAWIKRHEPSIDVEGLPPGSIPNIVSAIMARDKDKPAGKKGIDRTKIDYGRFPQLEGATEAMTDEDVSQFIQDRLEEGGEPGEVQYKEREGSPKLKIIQDDAFMRSGLKSGDTVCIKIP